MFSKKQIDGVQGAECRVDGKKLAPNTLHLAQKLPFLLTLLRFKLPFTHHPLPFTLLLAFAVHCPLFTVHCFSAGAPTFIAKQGQIRVGGQPANGPKSLKFMLFSNSTPSNPGGRADSDTNLKWSQLSDVYCINGMFQYPLGSGIDGLDFMNTQYYMSMSLDGGDHEMLPREPIAAIPYAFAASTATCLRGNGHIKITGDGPHYILNGNVGIGTADVSAARLVVNGRVQDKTGYMVPVGTVQMYAGSNLPSGWLWCDGTSYSKTGTYADLFDAVGYTYGGSGDSFKVPDMRGRTPIGCGAGSGLTNRVLAATPGAETHVLTVAEMPGHSHNVASSGSHSHSIMNNVGTVDYWGVGSSGSGRGYSIDGGYTGGNDTTGLFFTDSVAHTHVTDSQGSGSAHNNMQPSIVLNYIIKY